MPQKKMQRHGGAKMNKKNKKHRRGI